MPGEALLIAIATIAVVVAGFTAVTSTLTPAGGAWSPAMRIRPRAIVSTSFNVVYEALAPLIVFAWLDDAHSALVVASAGVAIYATAIVIWRGRQFVRAGAYRTPSSLVLFAAGPTAVLLFAANALVFASLAVYALALLVQLSVARANVSSISRRSVAVAAWRVLSYRATALLPIGRCSLLTRASLGKFSCARRHAVSFTCAFGLVSIARSRPGRSRLSKAGTGSCFACGCCTRQMRPK